MLMYVQVFISLISFCFNELFEAIKRGFHVMIDSWAPLTIKSAWHMGGTLILWRQPLSLLHRLWLWVAKMAAAVSGIFWVNLCTVGGSGDTTSIFYMSMGQICWSMYVQQKLLPLTDCYSKSLTTLWKGSLQSDLLFKHKQSLYWYRLSPDSIDKTWILPCISL